ncbi:MAG TPA: SIMPL domain-containing protein, partial [Vicinamibacterales bacterium]|nr:SIMPL domain-containing protein [Vicinamibacterales bacterium]
EATVTVAPDQAQIDIGVTTQARSAGEAVQRNAAQAEKVIAELRQAAGAGARVRTLSYSVRPDYRHGENRRPEIVGYTASNIVRVTIDDLARIGDVIDVSSRSGANEIPRLQFGLKDPQAAQAEAIKAAAAKARSEANALAASLGVEVVRILNATETGAPVRPMHDVMFAARAEAAQTPIEAGTIEVSATVTLTVEIEQRR